MQRVPQRHVHSRNGAADADLRYRDVAELSSGQLESSGERFTVEGGNGSCPLLGDSEPQPFLGGRQYVDAQVEAATGTEPEGDATEVQAVQCCLQLRDGFFDGRAL